VSASEPTFVGYVESVTGGVVTARIRPDLPSALVLVGGESYRIGQIGGFFRIPLGYLDLYAVCTKVGAAAMPSTLASHDPGEASEADTRRWLSMTLFGESLGRNFQRGVGQYPTVGDEVHLATQADLSVIYGSVAGTDYITVGKIASSPGINGAMHLSRLISRHTAIVGSSGAGKSNFVAILMERITKRYQRARILVIDPHGEYAAAVGDRGYVFSANPAEGENEKALKIPYWALPFSELQAIGLGDMQPGAEAAVRDAVTDRKKAVNEKLPAAVSDASVSADSPVPFDIWKLWFDLEDGERKNLNDRTDPNSGAIESLGDPYTLVPNRYYPPGTGPNPPFTTNRIGITRQLSLLRSRLSDSRFRFLFSEGYKRIEEAGPEEIPDDLASVVQDWVGHDRQTSVFDLSGVPSEMVSIIVGTLLTIIYETLYWAGASEASGRKQPLLVIMDEAHRFVREGESTPAHRITTRIAKEGRKYGIGLAIVTQRPVEVDSTILSQAGTMISLRLTNAADRARVAATMPDDLGDLGAILPGLRTGEALVIGEAMPIPSRVRFPLATQKPEGADPKVAEAWSTDQEPAGAAAYGDAIQNWRAQEILQHNVEEHKSG
jgi:uncharacterized protein